MDNICFTMTKHIIKIKLSVFGCYNEPRFFSFLLDKQHQQSIVRIFYSEGTDHSYSWYLQLRNLVWASSKHDVYMAQNSSVMHWSSLLQRGTEVLHVAGQVVPKQKAHGARTLSRVQISSMALKDNLMVAGGFRGELIFKYVDEPGVAFCTNVADNKNSVTNAVDVYESPSGATRVTAASNDCTVKFLDAERCSLLGRFTFPWPVNNTSVSPDGKLLAVLGDSSDCVIADAQSGEEIATLRGHQDYSFSSAWHPGGHVLADRKSVV